MTGVPVSDPGASGAPGGGGSGLARWVAPLALLSVLFLVYAPAFLTDYLMNDEWAYVGRPDRSLGHAVAGWYRTTGRGLFGAVRWATVGFADHDPLRIQAVRFLGFAVIGGLALWSWGFLRRRGASDGFAFLLALLLFTQRGFQGLVGYCLVTIGMFPALAVSVAAFHLHFRDRGRGRGAVLGRALGVMALLLLAHQSHQSLALFAVVPLSWLALSDRGEQGRRIVGFLGLNAAALAASAVAFKLRVDAAKSAGTSVYRLGEWTLRSVEEPLGLVARVFGTEAYRGAFELWTHPFPLHALALTAGTRRGIAAAVALAWLLAVAGAVRIELRRARSRAERRTRLRAWAAVAACFGLAALFLVILPVPPEVGHRPHLVVPLAGVVLVSGAFALRTLFRASPPRLARGLAAVGIALSVATVLGAQVGLLRGIAGPRAAQIGFVRTELMARDPASWDRVVVVTPGWSGCRSEPCDAWLGQLVPWTWHATREPGYLYALESLGIDSRSVRVEFVERAPDAVPDDAVVVDWNKFAEAARRTER